MSINLFTRKAVLWGEIKAHEQEYTRLEKQIISLEEAKKDISFLIQQRLKESQDISEKLIEIEYNNLKENNQ